MRICYIADAGSIHTQRWLNYFAQKGHEVHLISPMSGEGYAEGIQLHLLVRLMPRIWPVTRYFSGLLWLAQTRRLVRTIKPDVLHAHSIAVNGYLAACSGFHPLVSSAWGSDVLSDPKNSKISRLAVEFALRKADFVLTTSQYLKGYLSAQFNLPETKVKALPWGVDLKIFIKGYETEVQELKVSMETGDSDFVVLSPRHLREHYRIENIVRAIPYITAKHPGVIVIILRGAAEDSQFESRVDKLIRQLGIWQKVRLIRRHLSSQEMAVLYNTCDAFISIPKSDQFASSIQEGMACGAIPIVGNLEVYRQYLTDGKNALFVDPDAPEDIAEKAIYCIEHPKLKQRFYDINRKIIEENEDWARNAVKVEQLYQNLLEGR